MIEARNAETGIEETLTDADVVMLYNAVIAATLTFAAEGSRPDVVIDHNLLLYKIARLLP